MDPYFYKMLYRHEKFLPSDLIRMDRAAIYLKNRIHELVVEIHTKPNKTIGDQAYRVSSFVRELLSLTRMGGEALFMTQAKELLAINERTPRAYVIAKLQELLAALEAYEAEIAAREELPFAPQEAEAKPPRDAVADTDAVFVIMPFRPEFNDVWNGGIKRACSELNLNPIRVDMINRSTNITDDIVDSIRNCHIAIADVTDNNPNVMFELGYAIAQDKPNVIISQSSDYLPFDIRHLRTIVYTNSWSGIEDLKVKLKEFLGETRQAANPPRKPAAKKAAARSKK